MKYRVVSGLAALVLAGCATPAPYPGEVLSGRLSVRVEAAADQPARQVAASFELRGDAQAGELDLSSPIGTVLARARWSLGSAELFTPAGRVAFDDLDQLAARTFGEVLPMAALFDWLRGRPWPMATSQAASAGGFEQLGWQVDLTGLPEGQVVARRLAAPVVTLRARMEPPR